MFTLSPLETWNSQGRTIHIVESPVTCQRKFAAFKRACGDVVCINDEVLEYDGVEWILPAYDVSIGERIGLRCLPPPDRRRVVAMGRCMAV